MLGMVGVVEWLRAGQCWSREAASRGWQSVSTFGQLFLEQWP